MHGDEPAWVSGVILAAGPSTRFLGGPKQLAELDGVPLVRRIAERALASRLSEVVVVVGHEAVAVRAALRGLALRVVDNPDYRSGQSGSVRIGLGAVDERARAAMFMVCDQPGISVDLLDRLIEVYLGSGGPIVEPVFQGRRGSPVLFDCSLFSELAAIEGDRGGRALLPRHSDRIVRVELDDDLPLRDVDTVEDLER